MAKRWTRKEFDLVWELCAGHWLGDTQAQRRSHFAYVRNELHKRLGSERSVAAVTRFWERAKAGLRRLPDEMLALPRADNED